MGIANFKATQSLRAPTMEAPGQRRPKRRPLKLLPATATTTTATATAAISHLLAAGETANLLQFAYRLFRLRCHRVRPFLLVTAIANRDAPAAGTTTSRSGDHLRVRLSVCHIYFQPSFSAVWWIAFESPLKVPKVDHSPGCAVDVRILPPSGNLATNWRQWRNVTVRQTRLGMTKCNGDAKL